LPVGYGLDARVRSRQLRAGRRALPQDRPPERQRAGNVDGRRLRQSLRLVAEEGLAHAPGAQKSGSSSRFQRVLVRRALAIRASVPWRRRLRFYAARDLAMMSDPFAAITL